MLEIPAKPWPFQMRLADTALLVIDMQRDFLEAGGFGAALGNDVRRLAPAIAPCRRLLATFRSLGLPVFHTREGHAPDLSDLPDTKRLRGAAGPRIGEPGPLGRVLVRGEQGHAIIPELAPAPGEAVIDKPGKGAFCATDLEERLRASGITRLVVAGVTTEVCVQTTLREANDRGFACLLAEDATESYFPEFKAATLAMIPAQGAIAGWIAGSRDIAVYLPLAAGRFPEDPVLLQSWAEANWNHPERAWRPLFPGVELAPVVPGTDGTVRAGFIRYDAGAAAARHRHTGRESIYVVRGSQLDENGSYGQGSFVVNEPGTAHQVTSPGGCVVLIAWESPVTFL